MDDAEIREFLGDGGTGVISFARDDVPYSVPMSYGFDPDGPTFYVRLGYAPESEKRSFAEGSDSVTFVVYRETPAGWKSVVATGRLDPVTEASLDATVAEALHSIDIPFVTIYDRPAREIEFVLNRLVVEELTGRKEDRGRTGVPTDGGPDDRADAE